MSGQTPPSPSVARCTSCGAAVDVSMTDTCPFCGARVAAANAEASEPAPLPPQTRLEPVRRKARPSPALGTRVIALVVGIALLAGVALLQRLGQPDVTPERSRREATVGREPAAAGERPVGPHPVSAAAQGSATGCDAWTEREIPRFYSFEHERVGRWFERLERYNDHRLRLDGDASAHASRAAEIARSRAARLGSLASKRASAGAACDVRLLV